MFIPDPDFFSSLTSDPESDNNKKGKKTLVIVVFWSHKLHKIEDYRYQSFPTATEKDCSQLTKNLKYF
jgi:hypothetical protein